MRKFSFLIIGLAILVYIPSFFAPFQFDDYLTVVVNPFIKNISRLDLLWMYDPSRFLTHVTFALNFHFGKLNTFGYHLVNLVFHIANTFLVFAFVQRVVRTKNFYRQQTVFPALIAALIFLLHPIQTSAVTYIAQRSTLMAVFFYMMTILTFWNYRDKNHGGWLGVSLLSTLAGCFCKPIMISVPFALWLVDYAFIQERTHQRKVVVSHLCVVLIIPVLLAYWRFHDITLAGVLSMTQESDALTRGQYLFTQFHVIWEYIRLLFLPVEQNLDYDFPIYAGFFNTRTVIAFAGLMGLLGLGFALFKRQRIVGFCILWFFLTLALESSIFPIKDVIFEHRLYLPMVGFSFLIAMADVKIKDADLMKGFAIGIIVVYASLSIYRNYIWSDRILFLEDAARKSPKKLRVLNSLAIAYAESGRYPRAVDLMKKILQLNPDDRQTVSNLANTYRLMGDFEMALIYYQRTLQNDPNNGPAYYFRSLCYFHLGYINKALEDVKKAQKLHFPYVDPEYVNTLHVAQ